MASGWQIVKNMNTEYLWQNKKTYLMLQPPAVFVRVSTRKRREENLFSPHQIQIDGKKK